MSERDVASIARKIRALLDQAESTSYQEEAEAFTAKATALMAKYRIDTAMLAAQEPEVDEIETRVFKIRRGPYVAVRANLLTEIAEAFECKVVFTTDHAGRNMMVLGFRSDIDSIDMLFTSLLLQADTAVRATQVPAGRKAVTWRRSFLHGFAAEVGRRLRTQMREARKAAEDAEAAVPAEQRTSTSVALVLAERSEQIASEYRRRWPRVTTVKSSPVVSAASQAGREAGAKASLSDRGRVSGRSAAALGR